MGQLTKDEVHAFQDAVVRRSSREPLQYIIGTAPFLDFEVEVGPGVFIPRPETEQLADWVMRSDKVTQPAVIMDVCAGSGVLAIALARHFDTAQVVAVEKSTEALTYLRRNVEQLAPQVQTIHADATESLIASGHIAPNSVDLLVSNPPYVPCGNLADRKVDLETAHYDPPQAVFSGDIGTDFTQQFSTHLGSYLADGALVAMEHDDTTGAETAEILEAAGLHHVEQHQDLAGRPRFVTGIWN